MSNNTGDKFDTQILFYFIFGTIIIYVTLFLVLQYFGYTFSDVPDNGNIITPLLETVLTYISDFVTWLTTFSLFSVEPFGFLSGFATLFTSFIDLISSFINVWNVLNIYVFYILFIPYAFIGSLIIFNLIVSLIEGLIP